MTSSPIVPPADVVPVLPAGIVSFGMQLPVQSQSTIYVEPWEPAAGPDELARVARSCEAAGFFYVGVCDHTFIPDRLAGAMSTTWYDTIATLGWLAGVTSEIRLLSHIYVAALRHPLRAAKEFATVDVLSSGRVICGVGAGHVTEEFDLMGPPFDGRGPATDEAIAGIALGLSEEFPVLAGPRWPASGVGLRPRPVQSPRPPIWVGGSSPAALRRTARFADGWLPQSVGPNVELLATLRDLRAEFRDGAPLDIGAISYPLYLGTPPVGNELPPGTVQGSPDQLATYLRPFADAGVGQVQVRFPAHSADELCDQIAGFGAEVIPLVNG
ncbi:MAG: TIGR03619 family F420-dependent LLM class oxidoreductase [Acidimicrobiales bacterium]